MTIRTAVTTRAIWFAAASAFNLMSLREIASGDVGWAGDQPLQAQFAATVMACAIIPGLLGWTKTYRVLCALVLYLLFVGGVLRHLVTDPTGYASTLSRAVAIAINLFGSSSFAMGAGLNYRRAMKD